MATYVNDLRLKEIATGDESGTWGTSTNTNLELIGEALGYGTQDCFSSDADATTTVADGATDPARSMYFKVTSSATLTATRTLTIAPNTISRVMFIENATTGSQSINISQGSGANVTIATGKTTVVYLDGAGSGAAVVDALALVDPGVTDTLAEVLAAGNTSGGTGLTMSSGDDLTLTGASYNAVWDSSDSALEFADNAKAVFGAGSDLQIYHDGSHSYISDQGTGNLRILAENFTVRNPANNESMIIATPDAGVTLYYDNAAKLATTSTGVDVTGTVTAASFETDAGGTFTTASGNDLNIVYPSTRSLFIKEGSDTHVTVDNAGNVGIGTSSPSKLLHVSGTSDFLVDVAGSDSAVVFKETGGNSWRIGNDSSTDAFTITQSETSLGADVRFFIANGGNVGIGTSSPSALLEVNSGNDTLPTISSATKAIFATDNTTGFSSAISIIANATGNADIQLGDYANEDAGIVRYDNANDALVFVTATSERLRIDSSGNVLIGTTSGSRNLVVKGSASGTIGIDGAATGNQQIAFAQDGTEKAYLTYWDSSDTLALTDGSANGLHFSPSTGNVGIGTSSPAVQLSLKEAGSTSAVNEFVRIENNAAGGAGAGSSINFNHYHAGGGPAGGAKAASITAQNMDSWAAGTPSSYSSGLTFGTIHENSFAERMRIDSSGNVIVKAGKELRVNRPDDATYGAISHGAAGTGIVYNDANGDGHHWQFAGSEKARIDASGKLLIGDSASHTDDLLQIETPASGGGHGIQIRRNDANGDQTIGTITFGNNTDTDLAQIKAKTDGDGNSGDSGALLFSTQVTSGSLTERMRIDSVGVVRVGAVGLQTSSKFAARANGDNIEFGHVNNSAGFYGTIGARYNSGMPFIAFSADDSGNSSNQFTTRGTKGNVIANETDGSLAFLQVTTANAADQDPTERMRIDSNGNVGIGLTNPSDYYAENLVVAAADEGGITIECGSTEKAYLMFADGTSGNTAYRGYFGYDHSVDSLNICPMVT